MILPPHITISSAETRFQIKGMFEKKSSYFLYDTLVIYVPVLGARQFKMPLRVFFDGFLAEDEQTC